MDARKVAAKLAAYVWYENTHAGKPCEQEAARFARRYWIDFLPGANKGIGALLLRLAEKPTHVTTRRPGQRAAFASAG